MALQTRPPRRSAVTHSPPRHDEDWGKEALAFRTEPASRTGIQDVQTDQTRQGALPPALPCLPCLPCPLMRRVRHPQHSTISPVRGKCRSQVPSVFPLANRRPRLSKPLFEPRVVTTPTAHPHHQAERPLFNVCSSTKCQAKPKCGRLMNFFSARAARTSLFLSLFLFIFPLHFSFSWVFRSAWK